MSQLSPSSRVNSVTGQYLPKKEEWALIYQHKAKQYERLKQLEKQKDREKKSEFKRQLDNQINSKNDVNKMERQQDRRYYDYITRKAQEMKQKQETQKNGKIMKRKQVQQDNKYLLQMHHQRSASANPKMDYSFDIGYKSERDRKIREEQGKRTMMDALDRQLRIKDEQHRVQKMQSMQLEQKNNQIQDDYFSKRNRNRSGKDYGQNVQVYKYYQDLNMQKVRRERELEHRLVDEAAMTKAEEEYRKKVNQNQKKSYLMNQMKETLSQQVRIHNYKKAEEHRINPQDNSYGVIANMFRQKPKAYDQRQYSDYLKYQAEQQKRKKNEWNHMSEQEYRLNLNQLNKAVTGNYAHQSYHDRSLTAIGQKESKLNYNTADTIPNGDEDAEIVKHRIQSLKQRRRNNNDLDQQKSSIF